MVQNDCRPARVCHGEQQASTTPKCSIPKGGQLSIASRYKLDRNTKATGHAGILMVTREELYEAVWTEPLIKLAERFKVSGSYLARVRDSLGVPRPDRGHWAKLDAGKAPPRPALPPVEQGEPTQWSSGNGVLIRRSSPGRNAVQPTQAEPKKTHPLLHGAAAHFGHGRKVEDGEYLKPYKRYLVDITSTQDCLRHALSFANTLFMTLEAQGYRVGIFGGQDGAMRRPSVDPLDTPSRRAGHNPHHGLWVPGRLTVAYVNGQMVGLSIVEVAESTVMRYVGNGIYVRDADYVAPRGRSRHLPDSTWTTTKERPSGRLRLVAYVPHYRVDLTKHWQETDKSPLIERVASIVTGITAMAAEMVELVTQAERQIEVERREREAEWRRYKTEENKRRIRESIKDSHQQLDSIINRWIETRTRSDFLSGLEQDVATLPEAERESMKERIALARDMLGSTDKMSHFRAWLSPAERYAPKQFDEEE